MNEIKIEHGCVLIYRVFDVAEEISLEEAERSLSRSQGEARLRFVRSNRSAIVMRNAPIRVQLGEQKITLGDKSVQVETLGTVWDYGVVSVLLQLNLPQGTSWDDLMKTSALLSSSGSGPDEIDAVARKTCDELVRRILPAIRKPSTWETAEDYVIYFLEKLDGISQPIELLEKADIPSLMLAETKENLAPINRQGILENVFQYATNDLTVIDWDSALVVEPSGNRDVVDVLEFTLTHLLEARYYDDLLDRRLQELYDAIEKKRATSLQVPFAALSKEASTRYLEFTEIIERVNNSLKVVGDFYLAVIFRGAARRFRISDWQESITRKMNLLARVSELLQGELHVYRSHLMEIVVILLISFEIVSALVRH